MKRLNVQALNMPTLFDFSEPATTESPAPAAPVVTIPKPEPKKPDFFTEILKKMTDFAERCDLPAMLRLTGGDYRYLHIHHDNWHNMEYRLSLGAMPCMSDNRNYRYHNAVSDNEAYNVDFYGRHHYAYHQAGAFTIYFAALDDDAAVRILPVTVTADYIESSFMPTAISVGKWQPQKKIVRRLQWLQDDATLHRIIGEKKPWIREWLTQTGWDLKRYLMAPWMETLCKAGYAFASKFMSDVYEPYGNDLEYLNRLTQPGTKPANIFKADKCVYTVLKEKPDLSTWDIYRKMVKGGRLTKDTIQQAVDRNFRDKELDLVSRVLGAKYEDKPVFTFASLMNYLGRVDMYEAILPNEGLQLLCDYLSSCRELNMAPRIDGDSLKREHDVAARLVRQHYDEIKAREMAKTKERVKDMLPHLEYHEDVYFIRPIFDYDTLIDEATQQHNCLACYADRILKGETYVLQMRETRHPEKSLISIELSPDLRQIRQKYLAGNQPIRNKSQNDFIDRWLRQLHAAGKARAKADAQGIMAAAA